MYFVKAKTILSSKNGMNIYRGCTHGCIYCDSRSLCYHTPIPFENIEAKENAPELLEEKLKHKRKKCMIGTGSMCDPYMHCEKDLLLTRKCLEIIERNNFGATLITKSDMVLRDFDLLKKINDKTKAVLQMTLTTSDDSLCRIIEPNVCVTSRRFEVLMKASEFGIPTVVWLSPFLPYINDTEENIMGILNLCKASNVKGILNFGIGLTLREGNREYFYSKLDQHFPGLKKKYAESFGNSYVCASPFHSRLMKVFHDFCRQNGIMHNNDEIFEYLDSFPLTKEKAEPTLFDF